jgi:hypothetical protein
MAGLGPVIHAFDGEVDGWDTPGHDKKATIAPQAMAPERRHLQAKRNVGFCSSR